MQERNRRNAAPTLGELRPLPSSFESTRRSLHALACYVIAPARKARTGRIGLCTVRGGFGTPPLDDGERIVVRGDRLERVPGDSVPITTLSAAALFVGIDLSADPGVGRDLPPFVPDAMLAIDRRSSGDLGAWYAFGQRVFDDLRDVLIEGIVSDAQLWPEHFDLAVVVTLDTGRVVTVGFSPGDRFDAEPYVYVGPSDSAGLCDGDAYWNAPFGALRPYGSLAKTSGAAKSALVFILEGLARLR